jgi:hypothetical protein
MTPFRLPDACAAAALAALLAAAPATARAEAEEIGHGGTLSVSADPPRLLLGREGEARIRIDAPPGVGAVEVTASVGRIESVRREGDGRFGARWIPPARHVPQVAIVAAVARGASGFTADGWVAIPLSARATLRVKTRPGTEIALRVGERTFGPRTAGGDGIAVLRVVVPPGVREAHHGFRPIDLEVPDSTLLHAVADRTRVLADRTEEIRVLAWVVAPHGAARRGDVPVFEPTRGDVRVVAREPGAYEARWSLPPGGAGFQRLAIRLPGAAASTAALRVEAIPGPPATVAVALDRSTLVAGDGGEVAVTARVLDRAGNTVPAGVALDADLGTVARPARRADGATVARWRVPPRFGDRSEATITARVPGSGVAFARRLALEPGAPAVARLEPHVDVIFADGERSAMLRVRVRDRFGNPVAGLLPVAHALRGRAVASADRRPGVYLVRYVPPAVGRPTDERIEIALSGLRTRAEMALVPPRDGLALAPDVGWMSDLRGRFGGTRVGVALERPWAALSGVALRAEIGWGALVGSRRGALATVLGGAALRGTAGGARTWASAGVGLAVAGGGASVGAAPAARVAVGAGIRRTWGMPFTEVGVLAAGATAPSAGPFAAATVALGVRLETDWLAPGGRAGVGEGADADLAHRR